MTAFRVFGPEKSDSALIAWTSRLDGALARMRLQYIERCDRWDFQVGDSTGELVMAGQRVVIGWDMLQPFSDIRLPPGRLWVVDSTGVYDANPGRDGWRERYWLMYETADDTTEPTDLLVTEFVAPPIPE